MFNEIIKKTQEIITLNNLVNNILGIGAILRIVFEVREVSTDYVASMREINNYTLSNDEELYENENLSLE